MTDQPDMLGAEALARLLVMPDVRRVLDVGSGVGAQAAAMRDAGKIVTTLSLKPPADWIGRFEDFPVSAGRCAEFDALWCCHCLEHAINPHAFLAKCFAVLGPGGVLAVTVPPLKHGIVSGHLSLWNAGLLLYHLILAGFDCSSSAVARYGYNVSVIVRRCPVAVDLPPTATIDNIAPYMPVPVEQGFDGNNIEANWTEDE